MLSFPHPVLCHASSSNPLQHRNTNPAHPRLINLIPPIHSTRNRIRVIVIQVIMQLSVSLTELLVLEEQYVVHQSQRVEDVELVSLGEDEAVVHQRIQAYLEGWLIEWCGEPGLGRVVEEVGRADDFVLGVVDHSGLERVEGEVVGDLLGLGVLGYVRGRKTVRLERTYFDNV
jgi:hypothetical protein